MAHGKVLVLCAVGVCSASQFARAQEAPSIGALKKLTVAELMNIEVTSASRSAEPWNRTAAALDVVTNEDIRRSGATSVPEALRQVPGIHVGRLNSSQWAISARGFSGVNSEKLLVLTDTRSIYTPLFSGVLWDVQDLFLQDVERIEVIRGPGATLWGSNAVNGVINITTKSARETQGLYLETSAGTEERATIGVRYGGRAGSRGYYRVFGKYFDRDATLNTSPASADDWWTGHVGFRADWDATAREAVTVQGDLYRGEIGQLAPAIGISGRPGPQGRLRVHVGGGNVLARWRRSTSKTGHFEVRAYYDRTHRNDPSFLDDLDTADVDLQHRLTLGSRHELTWGSSYRFTSNRNVGKGIFAVDPPRAGDHLFSGFVQDQIRIKSSLRVTAGTKLEHNDFSGAEVQPSGRVAWDVAANQLVWGAVSRAVRVPTRLERDLAIDVTDPRGSTVVRLLGNADFDSERLLAYEAGYRWQARESLSIDLAVFHNRYRGLASLEIGTPFADPTLGRTVVPIQNQNLNAGRANGQETLVTYAPVPSARLSASYSYVHIRIDPGGQDQNRGRFLDGATPRHQLGLHSALDLPARFQFDAQFRSSSDIRRLPQIATGQGISGYSELDVRLAWTGWKRAELAVVAQNLLHDHHEEFGSPEMRGAIQRGVYGTFRWGF